MTGAVRYVINLLLYVQMRNDVYRSVRVGTVLFLLLLMLVVLLLLLLDAFGRERTRPGRGFP